jgi:hypothetical protein
MGMYRAVLISGPPGIGKTTSAHIAAKLAGYSPIELNASDTRSKKLIEVGLAVFICASHSHRNASCRVASPRKAWYGMASPAIRATPS